jgi:hypothetical protein
VEYKGFIEFGIQAFHSNADYFTGDHDAAS